MTNYNERLDEILQDYSFEVRTASERGDGKRQDKADAVAKQAITSLIKELVAEAEPESQSWDGLEPVVQIALSARRRAIDEFEQNLLKALEEV